MQVGQRLVWGMALSFICGLLIPSELMAKDPSREERQVTWADAPPIAHKLKFILREAKSLFYENEEDHVTYPDKDRKALMRYGQKHGRPYIRGQWGLTPGRVGGRVVPRTVDRTYVELRGSRPGNPSHLTVYTECRYTVPLSREEAAKESPPQGMAKLYFVVRANSFQNTPANIEKWRKNDAKRSESLLAKKHKYFDYLWIPDLKFGITRSDMFCYLNKTGKSCQIEVRLASEKHLADVKLTLITDGGALSHERAMHIAKAAAAIMSNKIWGTNIKAPKKRATPVGINEIWLTQKRGVTPAEDRHDTRIKLGTRFDVAVAYRTPDDPQAVRINVFFRPGQDAVANSIERTKTRTLADLYKKPLDPTDVDGIPAAIEYGKDGKPKGVDVKFEALPNGMTVAYIEMDTQFCDAFVRGPGSWTVEVEMEEVLKENLDGDDKVRQLSTSKSNLTIVDDPAVSRHYYNLK